MAARILPRRDVSSRELVIELSEGEEAAAKPTDLLRDRTASGDTPPHCMGESAFFSEA